MWARDGEYPQSALKGKRAWERGHLNPSHVTGFAINNSNLGWDAIKFLVPLLITNRACYISNPWLYYREGDQLERTAPNLLIKPFSELNY